MAEPMPGALGLAMLLDNEEAEASQTLHRLAGVQDSEGIRLSDHVWCWVTCFLDLDYEYAYLVDVRYSVDGPATSDYLAIFKGYDRQGMRKFRTTWHGHPATFPEVPNLYDAIIWWGQWIKQTREAD